MQIPYIMSIVDDYDGQKMPLNLCMQKTAKRHSNGHIMAVMEAINTNAKQIASIWIRWFSSMVYIDQCV